MFRFKCCKSLRNLFSPIISIGYHNQGAGGSMNGLLLLHLGYGQEWFQNGLIEELLLHEASHACLDEHHKNVRKFEKNRIKNEFSFG